jgi:ribosomal protein S18 acetylase RimI-like enzyme
MNTESPSEFEFITITSDQDFAIAKELFLEYASTLSFDLCFQNFDKELEDINVMYKPPDGGIIILKENITKDFIGCVGIRRIDPDHAELKRMYIREPYRDMGLGRQLLNHAIKLATKLKYKILRLDTMPSMVQAISLYKKYGFKQIEAYRYNPDINAIYLELSL